MSEVAEPNSPPAANPWMSRASRMRSGAASPMTWAGGMSTIIRVPANISQIVSVSAGLRPFRSAKLPSTIAPTGRMKKDRAKVPRASITETAWLSEGKNATEMYTEKYA
jgi:hypothetical protein